VLFVDVFVFGPAGGGGGAFGSLLSLVVVRRAARVSFFVSAINGALGGARDPGPQTVPCAAGSAEVATGGKGREACLGRGGGVERGVWRERERGKK